jgi:hypothetical protein
MGLRPILEGLKTRDDLEKAVALVIACLMLPAKDGPQEVLLKLSAPSVGELLLTAKQAELYAKARLILYEQRR